MLLKRWFAGLTVSARGVRAWRRPALAADADLSIVGSTPLDTPNSGSVVLVDLEQRPAHGRRR